MDLVRGTRERAFACRFLPIVCDGGRLSRDDIFITGRNFPAGSTVHLFAVDNQYGWAVGDPLVEVMWQASNGAMLAVSTTEGGYLDGISTSFDPVLSLRIDQSVSFFGGEGIVKVENAFDHVPSVPEPGTGMMLVAGFGQAPQGQTFRVVSQKVRR